MADADRGTDGLTLDDLHVGQRFESGTHALDAAQIVAFAQAFDPQRFHLDDAAARDTLFGGLAASGWHTAAVTMKLLVGGGAFLVIYLLVNLRLARRGYSVSSQKVFLLVATGACSIYAWGWNSWGEAFFIMNLFHAVQYLPFVYRVEDSRRRAAGAGHAALVGVVAAVLLAGWLAFELVPGAFDALLGTSAALGISFFVIAAMLFINIHHYFIDNVIWRFADPEVRSHLLS